MAKRRFAAISTTRLDLSEGDWIEVKDELTYGERLTLSNASMVGQANGMTIIDYSRFYLKRMETYITDWNLPDRNGKSTVPAPALFALLDEETAQEINAALDAHIAKVDAERFKNASDEPEKNVTSDSASAA